MRLFFVVVLIALGVWFADAADNYYTNQRQLEVMYKARAIENDFTFVLAEREKYLTETPYVKRNGRYDTKLQELTFEKNSQNEVLDISTLSRSAESGWKVLLLSSNEGVPLPGVDTLILRQNTDFSRFTGKSVGANSRVCSFVSELSYHLRGIKSSYLLVDIDALRTPSCSSSDLTLPDHVDSTEHLAYADIVYAGPADDNDETQVRSAAWVDINILNNSDFGLAGRNLIQGSPSNVYPIFALVSPTGRLIGYIRGKPRAKHLAATLIRKIMSDPEWSSASHMLDGFDDIYSEGMLNRLENRDDGDRLTAILNAALHSIDVSPISDDHNYYPVTQRIWPKAALNRPTSSDLFWLIIKGKSTLNFDQLQSFYMDSTKEQRFRQIMSDMYKEDPGTH